LKELDSENFCILGSYCAVLSKTADDLQEVANLARETLSKITGLNVDLEKVRKKILRRGAGEGVRGKRKTEPKERCEEPKRRWREWEE
jgi:hypothetical protein